MEERNNNQSPTSMDESFTTPLPEIPSISPPSPHSPHSINSSTTLGSIVNEIKVPENDSQSLSAHETGAASVEFPPNPIDQSPIVSSSNLETMETQIQTQEKVPETQQPSDDKNNDVQNSVVGRLTVEQLLEYVKKQNAKVKKLKMENDEIRNQLESKVTEPQTNHKFWGEIQSRPVWQQRLARGVINYLFQALRQPKNVLLQLRRAFLHWSRHTSQINTLHLEKKLLEATDTQSQLEQRVAKLKTLLAKMHQSNQKNVEDSVLARKNQLEIAVEYQQRMTQEEAEKQALEEQLRSLTFQSALHSDMEFIIEKAAQQIAAQTSGSNTESSQALKFFELQQQIANLEKEIEESKKLCQTYETKILQQSERILSADRQLDRNKENEERYKSQISQLHHQNTELEIARQDLEVELKILLSNRTNVAAEIETRASSKASQMLKTAEMKLTETQTALESWEKRALISESREERQNREISILRKQVSDFQTIQLENENLVKIVREMKKSIGNSPDPQGAGAGGGGAGVGGHSSIHSSEVLERQVSGEERSLLKQIHQEAMLIVDRETIQHILRQAEMHERSLLSASQHLTVFDSQLQYQKKRNVELDALVTNFQFLSCEQNQYFKNIINVLSLRTLRNLDTLLGLESLPTWGTMSCSSNDLSTYLSKKCRERYTSILQNIDNLDTLLLQIEDPANNSHEDHVNETSVSIFPSLLELSPTLQDDHFTSYNISERYQQALIALRSNSQSKNLTSVYHRILKKIRKTEQQMEEHLQNVTSARAQVEIASNAVSACLSEQYHQLEPEVELEVEDEVEIEDVRSPTLPIVTIHPHHLKWEAIDIRIPAGGMVSLPIPVPILPQTSSSNSELLILAKQLSVSWAIRSSSVDYAQVAISVPSLHSTSIRCERMKSEHISLEEVAQRGIQFGYVRSHEDVLSRIGEQVVCGQHIINTSDGNRVLEISNKAVWASITLSYQIQIDNFVTEPIPLGNIDNNNNNKTNNNNSNKTNQINSEAETERKKQEKLEIEKKFREEQLAKLHQLQTDLTEKQDILLGLQQRQELFQSRIHSMTGPLLLLRETFKTGIYLREKFCSQWHHAQAIQDVFQQHLENTCEQHQLSSDSTVVSTSFDQQSVWLQDIELMQKVIEDHREPVPLVFTHIFPPQTPKSPQTAAAALLRRSISHDGMPTQSLSSRSPEVIAQLDADPNPILKPPTTPTPTPTTITTTTAATTTTTTKPERILLSSSNLKIRPSCDFRCPIKIPQNQSPDSLYTLSWDFTLQSLSGRDSSSASESHSNNTIDIGFCVLGKSFDGSFPLLTPYQRIGPIGTNIVGSLTFQHITEDELQDEPKDSTVLRIPYSEVILLFDNTYSWFKPKHIRYEISLDWRSNCTLVENETQDNLISNDIPPPTRAEDPIPVVEEIINPHHGVVEDLPPPQEFSSSLPKELLTEVTGTTSKILQLSEEIYDFIGTVTSLTYK